MTIHYTKRAEQALDEIASYTLREWGEEQLELYMAALAHACEVLVPMHAKIARAVSAARPFQGTRGAQGAE